MAEDRASARAMDFTNVKDGGTFTKKRQAEGDYRGRITKVQDVEAKSDNTPMWLFTVEVNGETYPYYCKLVENQLWKVRLIFGAAGTVIPKKRMRVDPNKIVGRYVGVTLQDTEYEGKLQSEIRGFIPVDEVVGNDEDVEDDVEDDEEEIEEPPARPTRKAKPAPEPEPEDDEEEEEAEDEEEEEEEEEEPPTPPKRAAKKAAPVATAKKATAKGKSRVVDDEDLEDLDLEGL